MVHDCLFDGLVAESGGGRQKVTQKLEAPLGQPGLRGPI